MKETINTPYDYSDNRIWVYFELGGKKLFNEEYMLDKIDFINKEQIIDVTNGFNLFICNQHIPEVVKILRNDNLAIYQIVRVK